MLWSRWCYLIVNYYACWEWGVVVWYAVSKWHFRLDLDLTLRPCIDSTLQATLPVYSLPNDRCDRVVWVTCWIRLVLVVIVGLWAFSPMACHSYTWWLHAACWCIHAMVDNEWFTPDMFNRRYRFIIVVGILFMCYFSCSGSYDSWMQDMIYA